MRTNTRTEEAYLTEMPADPGLNLEFVDEALALVRDAEEKGIRLRILGSIAYRLQCPENLHLFQDTKRVLTDVDFGAEKKQNRAIREFLTARGYIADEGIYMASEGARHAYLHGRTGLNVDVFADELYFCHRIPFKERLDLDSPTICTTDLLLEKMQIVEINLKDFKDTIVLMLEHTRNLAEHAGAAPLAAALTLRDRLRGRRVALVLSGGNISPEQLADVLARRR